MWSPGGVDHNFDADLLSPPIIRENTSIEKANLGARGDGSHAPSPRKPRSGEAWVTVPRGRRGGPHSRPQDPAQQLRFLLGLREVSPSAEETAAAPPSRPEVIYLFSNKGGAPLLSI